MIRILILLCLFCANSWASVNIERWQTKNGTQVLFVNSPNVPMLDIKVAFKAGSAFEGKHYGLSALTTDLLDQGSKNKSADEIADILANSGAQVNSNTTRDMAIISLRTLTEPKALAPALTAFELVLNHPSFPSKAFEREKEQQIAAIKQNHESPNTLANEAFFAKLYGKHPYAHPVLGTAESVSQLKQNDAKQFYNRYFVGKNATMAIVGAISKQQAMGIAEQLTHAKKPGKKAQDIKPAKELSRPVTQSLRFPSSQTAIRIGQLGITHHNPDYFPLMVGNYTLGGGSLVSRLAYEIREQRGLSYNVSSAFIPMPARGPFIINLATKSLQAQRATDVTLATLNTFIAQGPSQQELDAAKKYLTGSFPLSIASNQNIAGMLLKIGFYDLPMDFLSTYQDKVTAVTQQQIKQAFSKQLHTKQLVQISVGKPAMPQDKSKGAKLAK